MKAVGICGSDVHYLKVSQLNEQNSWLAFTLLAISFKFSENAMRGLYSGRANGHWA